MSDKIENNNQKIYGLPLNLIRLIIIALFLLFLLPAITYIPISWFVLINILFIIYYFRYVFNLSKPFRFSKHFEVLSILFLFRIVFIISFSDLVIKTNNSEDIVDKFFFIGFDTVMLMIFILFSTCAGLFYYLKNLLNNVDFIKMNENQIVFKNNLLNILSFFKIIYVLIIFTFVIGVLDIYIIYYKLYMIYSLNIFLTFLYIYLALFFVAVLPIILISMYLLITAYSCYCFDNNKFNPANNHASRGLLAFTFIIWGAIVGSIIFELLLHVYGLITIMLMLFIVILWCVYYFYWTQKLKK